MRTFMLIAAAVAVIVTSSPAFAQQPGPATPASAAKELPKELQLELVNLELRDQLAALRAEYSRLVAEHTALQVEVARPQFRGEVDTLKKRAIEALGGDPTKDNFDWAKRELVKAPAVQEPGK